MSIHAVIDFETTGLSPALGARPTEVAIVLIAEGKIIDRFQSLMNPGVSIPNDIQVLTGITNEMVRKAPKVEAVSLFVMWMAFALHWVFLRNFANRLLRKRWMPGGSREYVCPRNASHPGCVAHGAA